MSGIEELDTHSTGSEDGGYLDVSPPPPVPTKETSDADHDQDLDHLVEEPAAGAGDAPETVVKPVVKTERQPTIPFRKKLPECAPPAVVSLVLWDNVRVTCPVFIGGCVLLTMLNTLSFISVFAYINLIIIGAAYCFRLYTGVQQTIHSEPQLHPLRAWLARDVRVTSQHTTRVAESLAPVIQSGATQLRGLVLLERPVSTLKFGALMYGLTFIGAMINFLTLVTIVFVAVFTLPFVYDRKQAEIDAVVLAALAKLCSQLSQAWANAQPKINETYEKLPAGVKNVLAKVSATFQGTPHEKSL